MRLKIFSFITLILFVVLILSLWNIQINKHNFYKQLSDKNRIRLVPLPAARGSIYDRRQRILAEDKPLFTLSLIPNEFSRQNSFAIKRVLEKLSKILGLSVEQIKQRINKKKGVPFAPLVILGNLSKDEAIAIEEKNLELPGITIQIIPQREYPYKNIAGHIVGYIGRINADEVKQKRYGYQFQNWVGRMGIERSANIYLSGENGGRQIEVNHLGRQVRELGIKLPRRGEDIHLTIDIDLQKAAHKILAKQGLKGTIIVMNPHTGGILAMVSEPCFDPNDFVSGNKARITKILNNSASPLLNRAISGLYAPGSVFKPIVAIAALETKKILPVAYLHSPGRYLIGNRFFYCWKKSGHGWLNIKEALAYSANVFFYKAGEKLGVNNLTRFALLFGLGKKTGIELPGEKDGLVPNKRWKLLNKRKKWYKGETALFSIGQGYLLVTPLQMARAISVIANGGYLVKPIIIRKSQVTSHKLPVTSYQLKPVTRKLNISLENINAVRDGMVKAVEDENGTAHRLKINNFSIAAKTGTAQVKGKKSNSWIVGFCPVKEPEIVFVILIEQGGLSARRVNIARELVEKWREIKIK